MKRRFQTMRARNSFRADDRLPVTFGGKAVRRSTGSIGGSLREAMAGNQDIGMTDRGRIHRLHLPHTL